MGYTFVATGEVVVLHFARPVFIDSVLESFLINAEKIEAAIKKKTKAILPLHLGGSPADLDKTLKVADTHKFPGVDHAIDGRLKKCRSGRDGKFK